jgi:TPR repeat protein
MGSVSRRLVFALLGVWFLTTGSTCQSTLQSSSFRAQGNGAAAVVLVVLVGAGVACLADPEGCGGREPTPFDQVRMTFESGVDRLEKGDSSGLQLICLAGLQGYAKAQYFYGVHLFRQDPAHPAQSLAWLRRAAAQDHKAARFVVAQTTGRSNEPSTGPNLEPLPVPPPALRACTMGARPGRPVHLLEATGETGEPRGQGG